MLLEATNLPLVLVDDEEHVLPLFRAALEEAGFRVVTAVSGEQALEVAQAQPPDLVVMDMLMPSMDGIQALGEMRKLENYRPRVTALTMGPQRTPTSYHPCPDAMSTSGTTCVISISSRGEEVSANWGNACTSC